MSLRSTRPEVIDNKPKQDDQLAREFSHSSLHSAKQIQKALSHFMDPDNLQTEITHYGQSLFDLIVPQNRESRQILGKELRCIATELKDARQFNRTYMGHMLSEPCIPALWGQSLADRINSNTVTQEVSIQESKLESQAIRGLMKIVGYDPQIASGTFTSGGSMANTTALTIARILLSKEDGQNKKNIGRAIVLASPYAHYSLDKAVRQLSGINGNEVQTWRVQPDHFKMSIEDLGEQIVRAREAGFPIMGIFAVAGETETGLVDNLASIAQIASRYGVRLITDGAFGAPYRISRKGDLFDGIEQSFAISIDPHKTLYTPYQNGAVLFKKAEDHAAIITLQGNNHVAYLEFEKRKDQITKNFRRGVGNLGQKRLEGSMGAGPILSTLAVLRTLGIQGLQIIYDLTLDRVDHLYDRLNNSELLMPLYKPELNLLCFTLKPEVLHALDMEPQNRGGNKRLKQFINCTRKGLDNDIVGKGGYFFSSTDLPLGNNKSICVYRACIMNPRTTDDIIDNAVYCLEKMIINELNK